MPARFRSEEGENSPSFTLIRAFVRIGSHPRLTVRIIERDGDEGLLQGGRFLEPGAAECDTLQSHQLSANRTIVKPHQFIQFTGQPAIQATCYEQRVMR